MIAAVNPSIIRSTEQGPDGVIKSTSRKLGGERASHRPYLTATKC
jgi:hypothetical protein